MKTGLPPDMCINGERYVPNYIHHPLVKNKNEMLINGIWYIKITKKKKCGKVGE